MPMPGGMTSVGVGINFSATDLASGPMGIIGRNFGTLQGTVRSGAPRIAAGFAAVTAGATAMGVGIGAIRQAWDFSQTAAGFERQMAAVRTISRASAEEFDALSESAVQAGIATKFSPEEAAGGLRVLAQQGLNANNAISALVPTLDFASAGQIEVSEAAEVGMGVLNAYGMQVNQLPMVYDRLMRATQMSALGANEFLTVMGRAASTGALYSQQLDEVMIALASVRSQGIPATVATTAVSEAFRRLGAERETQQLLQRHGVQVIDQETGRFRDFTTVLREFGVAISGLTEAEQARLVNQAFHVRGMRTFNAIANIQASVTENGTQRVLRGAEAHAYYRRQLEESAGTTAEFRDRDLATLAGSMDLIKGTVETLGTVIGMTFANIFNPMIRLTTTVLNKFILVWRAIPTSLQSIIGIVTLVVAGFSVFGGAITAIVGAVLLLVTVLGEVAIVAAVASAGIMAALVPIGLAFGGLIAIGYALYKAYEQNLGGLRDSVNKVAGQIQLVWRGVIAIFTGEGVVGALRGDMIAAGGAMLPFLDAIQNLWNNVQVAWTGIKSGFAEVWASMGPTIEELKAAFSELWGVLQNLFGTFIGGANSLPEGRFRSIGQTIGVFLGGALRAGIGLITRMITWVTSLIRIWRGMMEVLRPFLAMAQVIRDGVMAVLRPILALLYHIVRTIMFVQNLFNPVRWIGAGLEWLGQRQEGRVELTSQREEAQDRRNRQSRERREPAMERPAIAEGRTREAGGGGGIEIAAAIRESNRRRTPINMQLDVNLDGSQMQSIMRTAEVDGQSIDGGLPVSEWTDF